MKPIPFLCFAIIAGGTHHWIAGAEPECPEPSTSAQEAYWATAGALEPHEVALDTSSELYLAELSRRSSRPDLVIWAPSVYPRIEDVTFRATDCEVEEGCAVAGKRRLLRFGSEIRNQGTADLVVGDPHGNPDFVYHACHDHFHFEAFLDYRLLDSEGDIVARGHKASFELADVDRWDPNGPPGARYGQDNQGIQRGWSDIYSYIVPCQYIDITGIPPGIYTIELEVDPDNKLAELDEANNIIRVPFEVPAGFAPCDSPPPNDAFAAAQTVAGRVVTVVASSNCATRQDDEPNLQGNPGGHSIWFRWKAPYTGQVTIDTDGSWFTTLLGLYRGTSLTGLTLLDSDHQSGAGNASKVTGDVTAGTEYSIAVDGLYTRLAGRAGTGEVILNINANGNDSFAAAQPIEKSAGATTGTTVRATRESREPSHAGDPGGRSVWYSWTAPSSGPMVFDTRGSRFNTLLAIYTGTLPSLRLVASDDDGDGFSNKASRLKFDARAETIYFIAVDGVDGEAGIFTLNWHPDFLIDSTKVVGGDFRFTIHNGPSQSWMEISSDLITWKRWKQLGSTTGSLDLSDPLGPGQRFYRCSEH